MPERSEQVCECGRQLQADWIVCTVCGRVNSQGRTRRPENRPENASIAAEIVSPNGNGTYQLSRMSDGSVFCPCMSFLTQRGTQNGNGWSTCKHIRELNLQANETEIQREIPTGYQKAIMERLGVQDVETLTNDQAYWVIRTHLERFQDVSYKKWKKLVRQWGREAINLVPSYPVGIELEHITPNVNTLRTKLNQAGFPAIGPMYSHEVVNTWKLCTDSSLRGGRGRPGSGIEVVTPKQFGAEGLKKIRKVMKIMKEVDGYVNHTCGMHVHVDAWGWEIDDLKRLGRVWKRLEKPFLWNLVPPSRRNHGMAKELTESWFSALSRNGPSGTGRYWSLNIESFPRYGSVEFRMFSGTLNPWKATAWIMLCLKLMEAVKNGLSSRAISHPDNLEYVLEKVGIAAEGKVPLVEIAYDRIRERYREVQRKWPMSGSSRASSPQGRASNA